MADHIEMELTSDLTEWLTAFRRAQTEISQWTAAAETAKAHITAALDRVNADIGTVHGRPAVRWITVESRRVDGAALRADHPELAARYSRTSVARRFMPLLDHSQAPS